MATLSEMMFASASESSQKTADLGGSFDSGLRTGAALAEQIQRTQERRAQIEAAKADVKKQEFKMVGSWFETYAKMPEGPAKKAYGQDYIPKGISTFGLDEEFHPVVQKMFIGNPNLATYWINEIRAGRKNISNLVDPSKVAAEAKAAERFGNEQTFMDTIETHRPQLEEAAKFAESEEGKSARAAQQAGAKAGQQNVSNLGELRREITGHPTTKKTLEIADSYDKIRTNLGKAKPTAAGDMSGIFNFMKMNDPNSTVREGEYATAQQAAGIPEKLLTAYHKAIDGQILGAGQRRDFVNTAEKIYRSQFTRQQSLNKDYEKIAGGTRLDPELIFAGTKLKGPPPEKSYEVKLANGSKRTITDDQLQGLVSSMKGDESALKELSQQTKIPLGELKKNYGGE